MEESQSAFLTVKYKLHNLSQRRRAMLLDAMRRAHLAYDKILKVIRPDVEAMVGLKGKELYEPRKNLQKRIQSLAKPLPLGSGPKQAVIADLAAQAESFIALKSADANTSYPTVSRLRVDKEDKTAALEGLANSQTLLEENQFRDLLSKLMRPGIPRPLNILKNRVSDGALILKDDKNRLFAFINLLPASAKRKRKVIFDGLVDTRTGQIMEGSTSGGDLFPLEGSNWHMEKFLCRGTLQSSRLIFDGTDFYFAGTFQFQVPIREPVNYIGVDRGIELLAAWAVVDPAGDKIDEGSRSGEHLRRFQRKGEQEQRDVQRSGKVYSSKTRRAVADEEVHITANKIVSAALTHNARVVMEDLATIAMGPHQARPKGARRGGFRRMLTRAQYMKLKFCIDYRLKMHGFPAVRCGQPSYIEIHPAHTSITCSACGHRDKESRQSQAVFVCTKCGWKENADINAATNIAA